MHAGVKDLYLIRHARAVEQALHDWERPLMAEGRREARAVGVSLAAQNVVFDQIAVSPLCRAVETATLIAVETAYAGGLSVDHALTPDGSTALMLQLIEQLPGDSIALVGHEPSMGQFLSDLIARPGMNLVKGAVVRLSIDGVVRLGKAKLVWSLSPRQLQPVRV